MRAIVLTAVGILTSAVLGFFTFGEASWVNGELRFHARMPFDALYSALSLVDAPSAVAFVLVTWSTLLVRAWQWGLFLTTPGRWLDRYVAIAKGFLALQLLPARLGEVTRALVLSARVPGLGRWTAIGSVAVSRFLDLLALWLVCLPLPLLVDVDPAQLPVVKSAAALVTAAVGAAALGAFALGRHGHVGAGTLARFASALLPLGRPSVLARSIGATVAVQLLSTLAYVVVMQRLAPGVPAAGGAIVALAAGSFGLALPSSPGGFGVYHFSVAWALRAVGATPAQAAAVALVTHAGCLLAFVLAGVLAFIHRPASREYVPSSSVTVKPRSSESL